MGKETTKERILACGAQIVYQKGFNNTGIQEILQSAQVPKGSFYFYFKNKEEFGLALIEYYFTFFVLMAEAHLKSTEASPLKRLENYFGGFRAICEHHGCKGGCPIGNLTQELAGLGEAFQERLRETLDKMKDRIAECLELAREAQEVDPEINVDDTADFLLNSWEGALLRMKAERSTRPLILFEKMVFDRVLKG